MFTVTLAVNSSSKCMWLVSLLSLFAADMRSRAGSDAVWRRLIRGLYNTDWAERSSWKSVTSPRICDVWNRAQRWEKNQIISRCLSDLMNRTHNVSILKGSLVANPILPCHSWITTVRWVKWTYSEPQSPLTLISHANLKKKKSIGHAPKCTSRPAHSLVFLPSPR